MISFIVNFNNNATTIEKDKKMLDNYTQRAKEISEQAVRLDNDINGNPRYYISCVSFMDENSNFYRPKFANVYRGKKFGAGWVFQSYALENHLRESLASTNEVA